MNKRTNKKANKCRRQELKSNWQEADHLPISVQRIEELNSWPLYRRQSTGEEKVLDRTRQDYMSSTLTNSPPRACHLVVVVVPAYLNELKSYICRLGPSPSWVQPY